MCLSLNFFEVKMWNASTLRIRSTNGSVLFYLAGHKNDLKCNTTNQTKRSVACLCDKLAFSIQRIDELAFFHFCIKDITWIVIEGGVDLQQFVAEKHTNIGRSFNWSYYDALRKIIYVNKKWFLWPSTAKDCIKSMIIKHPINDNNETIDTGFPRNVLSLWTKNTTVHQI